MSRDSARKGSGQGEDVVERPSWFYPAILFAVTMIIALGILYLYFGPSVDDLVGNTPNASVSDRPITFVIAGQPMLVPENFTQFPRDRKGGDRHSVALYALLPDFAPFTVRNAQSFTDNSADSRVVHFQIEAFRSPLTESQRLERIYLERVVDPSGEPGPAGLRRFEFADRSGRFGNEDLFVAPLRGGTYPVIMCVRETAVIDNPNCRRDFEIGDGLAVSYRFKRSRLDDWQEINDGVLALINHFRSEGEAEMRLAARRPAQPPDGVEGAPRGDQ